GNFEVGPPFASRWSRVGPVLAGPVFHPFENAKDVLKFYRDFSSTTHDQLTTYSALLTSPDGAKVVVIGVCYTGTLEDGERLVAPVRKFGPPLMDQIRPMAYTELQTTFEAGFPPRNQYYEKVHFLREV